MKAKQNNFSQILRSSLEGIRPYLKFRKLLFYPLNYKAASNLLAKITVSVDLTRIKIQVPFRYFKYLASIGQ